jgi:hypothetical protein
VRYIEQPPQGAKEKFIVSDQGNLLGTVGFVEWLIERAGGIQVAETQYRRHALKRSFEGRPLHEVTMGEVLKIVDDNHWEEWFRAMRILDFARIFAVTPSSINPATYQTKAPNAPESQRSRARSPGRPTKAESAERIERLLAEFKSAGMLTRLDVKRILGVSSAATSNKVLALMMRDGMIVQETRGHTHVFLPVTSPPAPRPTAEPPAPAPAPVPEQPYEPGQ